MKLVEKEETSLTFPLRCVFYIHFGEEEFTYGSSHFKEYESTQSQLISSSHHPQPPIREIAWDTISVYEASVCSIQCCIKQDFKF